MRRRLAILCGITIIYFAGIWTGYNFIEIYDDEMLDFGYESVLQENTSKLKEYGFYVCMDGLELERAFFNTFRET